uniref:Uncharacterized protein n=1 Tax=Roseihalotalea indica TaxID=2867963 RepID=A0AA49GPW1_9BACT|nr:hypothetical protein K4G66_01280 [Tunicatimonas sp. TK19036]
MKISLFIVSVLSIIISCDSSGNQANEEKTSINDSVLGVWVLRKGGGNDTEYLIKKIKGKLMLTTKVMSPHMDAPLVSESELIGKEGKYVRESEAENPSYLFEFKNSSLVIYDSFGVYATLENEYE